ncbi:hypothetical protein [Streptomyces cyaneofuscatus]|uniref:hypothetical protein n=1 Tax=Streptomyces cyaneofuscatus TaxID=66883 RepID=UPI003629EFDF
MSGARIRYNFDFIRSLATSEGAQRVVMEKARNIDAALRSAGVQTKVDAQSGPTRARAAVIAGYEPGATAERTRRNLLLSLDAARDAE